MYTPNVSEFPNDDARTYILVASSQPELDGWMEVLKAARYGLHSRELAPNAFKCMSILSLSYESLREMKAALQKKLSELTGTVRVWVVRPFRRTVFIIVSNSQTIRTTKPSTRRTALVRSTPIHVLRLRASIVRTCPKLQCRGWH